MALRAVRAHPRAARGIYTHRASHRRQSGAQPRRQPGGPMPTLPSGVARQEKRRRATYVLVRTADLVKEKEERLKRE